MSYLASSSSALVAGAGQQASDANERLPVPQAALIVVSMSVGLWAGIILIVRWMVG